MQRGVEILEPRWRLFVEKRPLNPEYRARLSRLEIGLAEGHPAQALLLFEDPRRALIEGEALGAGRSLRIQCGEATLFDGEIVSRAPRFTPDQPPALLVRALDRLHRLALSPQTRSLQEVDTAEIVAIIARAHGLRGEAPGGPPRHFLQVGISDLNALQRLAAREGLSLGLRDQTLSLSAPGLWGEAPLRPADALSLRLEQRPPPPTPQVLGWSTQEKRPVEARADPAPEGARPGPLLTPAWLGDLQSAERFVRAQATRLDGSALILTAEGPGQGTHRPGLCLRAQGWGPPVDGAYRLLEARHRFDGAGHRVRLRAARLDPG